MRSDFITAFEVYRETSISSRKYCGCIYSNIALLHSNHVLVSPIIDSYPIGRQEPRLQQHGCTMWLLSLITVHNI